MTEQITEEKTIENNYMKLLQQDCEVFTDDVMEYPPSAISLGEKTLNTKKGFKKVPIPIGTYGNISFVQAPSKTGKTFFLSLLAGVFLSGNNIYGGNLKGHRDGRCLIHFDTEMGLWHTQQVAQRIENMAGDIDLGCYKKYALRKLGHRDMLKFIEYTLKENEGNNGLILIDGVADLVTEVNDIKDGNECVRTLMRLSVEYDCHIMTVIHSNYGSDKATGHLGSTLYKKCETAISLEKSTTHKGRVDVKCKLSRGFRFDNFSFEINQYELPFVVGEIYDPLEGFVRKQPINKKIPF
tara:strand:+ start:2127 stop:3014 length:888 start_codon:yes stop_codon:yes gene_type:complete